MGPALIGNASGQINVLVNTNLAAGLRDAAGHVMNGPVSWLAYAYRFFCCRWEFSASRSHRPHCRAFRAARHQEFRRIPRDAARSIMMILL